MIRVLLVDDHPALRSGVETVLEPEPDLFCVGAAAGSHDLWPLLNRTRPDVVVMDVQLAATSGLLLCHRIKALAPAPKVILYSAYADAALTVPAVVAGADAVVHKAAPAPSLLEAIRRVGAGDDLVPPVAPETFARASLALRADDLPIMDMLVDRHPQAEVAAECGLDPEELFARVEGILGSLATTVQAAA